MFRSRIITACLLVVGFSGSGALALDHGSILGRVTYEGVGNAVAGAEIFIYDLDCAIRDSAVTGPDGMFRVELAAGGYYVSAEKGNLVKEYFPGEYLAKNASGITVYVGQSIYLSFVLHDGGEVRGTLAVGGDAANRALVTALKIDQPDAGWRKSIAIDDALPCNYALEGLLPGTYKILGRATGKSTEYYPAVARIEEAAPVTVVENASVSDISFVLPDAGIGTINGRIYNQDTGDGISDIAVFACQWENFREDPNLMTCQTSEGGSFSLQVAAGDYLIFVLYPDQSHPGDVIAFYYDDHYDPINADYVVVSAGENLQGLDFPIDYTTAHNLWISGNVVNESSDLPLGDVVVTAIDCQTRQTAGAAFTSNNGNFTIKDLGPGDYLLMISGSYIIPYFFRETERWQDGEIISLERDFTGIKTEAITQDYGNMGLAISGKVVSGGRPLDEARVYAYLLGETRPRAFARTNSSGEYSLVSGLISGSYIVTCDILGYDSESYPGVVFLDLLHHPEAEDIDFNLSPVSTAVFKGSGPAPEVDISVNYPNPFNSSTIIRYYSAAGFDGPLKLSVYNVLGQLVGEKRIHIHSGINLVEWGSSDFSRPVTSGIYFYRVEGSQRTYRMVLLK